MGIEIVAESVTTSELDRSGWYENRLAGELAQELALVHAVLERFAAIDEHDRHFVGELPAQLVVGVHIDFLPAKQTAAFQFDEAFFDNLAKMTTFTSVNKHLAGVGHGRSVAVSEQFSIDTNVKKRK